CGSKPRSRTYAELVSQEQPVYPHDFGARRGDEVRLRRLQNPFAENARDFSDEEKAERDRRQDHMPRRFPKADGKPSQFHGKDQDQERGDDKTRDTNRQHGEETTAKILPASPLRRRQKSERQA